MQYSTQYIQKAKTALLRKMDEMISEAVDSHKLKQLLKNFGINLEENTTHFAISSNMKILVLGDVSGKKNDYYKRAKKLGISEDNLEFHGYDESANVSPEQLRFSNKYSDIIIGPIPHQSKEIGTYGSLTNFLRKHQESGEYPHCQEVRSNRKSNDLKFSITSFENALRNTRFYIEIISVKLA